MRFGFALGLILLIAGTASAADADFKTPYTWRIVVQTPVHPSLSAPVRERLCKDLKAALQPVVGDDLGRVEVVDLRATPEKSWEPLWKRFTEAGWKSFDEPESLKLTGI